MAQIILTQEERNDLTQIPHYITDEELKSYCLFDEIDIQNINTHKEFYNRMGYAVQLFHIRYLGWSYSAQTRIPSKVLNYIAEQLGEPIRAWNFKANYKRANTITRHFYEICKVYGYRELRKEDEANVFKMISANANVVDNRVFIVNEIISYLKSLMIILPKISTRGHLPILPKSSVGYSNVLYINTLPF